MINGKRVLAVIPARGGSKGIPRKNIHDLGGKPLLAWSIEAARACDCIDRLVLSSEDAEIIAVARAWGCEVPFVRPAELAQDDSPTIPALIHALDSLPERYDYLVLLQVTSPLRHPADIVACLELCEQQQAPACVSLVETHQNPQYMYRLKPSGHMSPVLGAQSGTAHVRRQDLPKTFALNGAVCVARVDWLRTHQSFLGEQTLGYVMPPERSLDIDTRFDLLLAGAVLAAKEQGLLDTAVPP
ncbi:MAG: acylneuraminate cytidylyltransferase family protein [Magnetococcales bacterium]|nr:acylneuraminate cytidylyltransferase family protein [Magnetococcales bacterium]